MSLFVFCPHFASMSAGEPPGKPSRDDGCINANNRSRHEKLAAHPRKFEAAVLKKAGAASEISDKNSTMHLSTQGIPKLVAFLKLLDDVSDERFQQRIVESIVLDTSAPVEGWLA